MAASASTRWSAARATTAIVVDDAKDVVTEAAGAGTGLDTVTSTAAAYTLGVNIEYLVLGTGALSGTGNTLNNTLTGNAGDNTLDGKTGNDHLIGDTGNDTYIVDNIGDVVDENGAPAPTRCRARSPSAWSRAARVIGELENLTLDGRRRASAGTGNDLANHLIGNAGANKLLGNGGDDTLEGGGGADTLDGGAGNNHSPAAPATTTSMSADGDDTVFYTSKLDGKDIIDNFDGDAADGGQDVLEPRRPVRQPGNRRRSIAPAASASRPAPAASTSASTPVPLHNGTGIVTVATLNTTDTITVGEDVVVGTS